MAIIVFFTNLAGFTAVKAFPILLVWLDLCGCMLIFGSGCLLGAIFVIFVMQETSNQSLDDVGADEQTKLDFMRARLNSI